MFQVLDFKISFFGTVEKLNDEIDAHGDSTPAHVAPPLNAITPEK
jgi:hypothetical protein